MWSKHLSFWLSISLSKHLLFPSDLETGVEKRRIDSKHMTEAEALAAMQHLTEEQLQRLSEMMQQKHG